MSTIGMLSSKPSHHRSHSYLAALVLGGSLLPLPIVATIFTAIIYIALLQLPLFSNPLISPWIAPNWLAIVAGFAITMLFWLLSALFFRNFTSIESANPISASHLKSHLSALRAGFEALNALHPNGISLPKEHLHCYHIAHAQVKAYLEEIDEILGHKDTRWVAGTGYIEAWRLMHRAEEAMIMLEPREEVIREAIYDEMALTGSSIPARASALRKLELAVKNLSASATQYLNHAESQDIQNVASNSRGQKSATVSETLAAVAKNPESPTTGEMPKTTDEKNLTPDGTSIVTAQGPDAALLNEMLKGATEDPDHVSVSTISIPAVQAPGRVATGERHVAHVITELEARNALRDVRRTIDEYRDHLWEGLVAGRNLLMGTAIITGLLTYGLLCFAIVAGATVEPIKAAIAFYLVGAVIGLFSRLYDESKVGNVDDNYGLTLARILVTPVLSGIAAVVGVPLTDLLSLTLSKSALPQLGLADSFNIQQNTLGILIAAAFALAPNLLINTLKKKANDFTDQLRNTSASHQAQSGNKP